MRKNILARVDPFFIAALVLAGFFLLKNLGNIYLWEDEAETALLARSVLNSGYPKGFDGVNLLKPTLGMGSEYWIYHPWGAFYILALFFWLFGESTFVSRLPFVLFGLGALALTYRLARRLYPEKGIARIALALLVFSVPFLINMRQCRYYAPTLFFSLWSMLAFVRFTRKKRFSSWELLGSWGLLFFTNNGIWIPTIVTQIAYLGFVLKERRTIQRFLGVLLVNLLLAVPWFFLARTFTLGAEIDWEHTRKNLEFYLRVTNKYIVPLEFWILFLGLLWGIGKKIPVGKVLGGRSSLLLWLWAAVTLMFLLFVEQRHFRYLISVLPVFFILESVLLFHLLRSQWRWIGWTILTLLLFTNVLNSPHRAHSPLSNFLYEITHDYDGPNEGIVLYLRKHAKPTDTVKLKYEDTPVMFYTGLKVDNRWYLEEETYPEWIIPRRPWAEDGFWESRYHANIQKRYERIELDYPDIQWENREDPGAHQFRTVRDVPKIIIYRRHDRS
ncbi:MAG: glycosyltransferase family 39 protein [Candidatus Omnitrophica bacterium]|nr:glycosyltransferase family 39 protein [Candidatus Omnitrophota bacterium]